MTYDFVQIGKTLVEKHTTIDEMDIHGEITRMPNCWFKLLPVMIAQQGAMSVVAGSHMAETDGETFSRLTSKLQGSDIQMVFEQLSVKVALSCPDLYGSFPERLTKLHLEMKGYAGSRNMGVEKQKHFQISRLGIWAHGFFKDVAAKASELAQTANLSDEDRSSQSIALTRINDSAESCVLKKRARDSHIMYRRYKRVKGQSKFYSEVFNSITKEKQVNFVEEKE